MAYTREDILRIVEEEGIQFIRLQFTDILGALKSVAITSSQLEKALDNKCMFDGSSIDGFVRIEESDMKLYPDFDSFCILPWRDYHGKSARLICDVYTADDKPFVGDPRYVLKRAINKAREMGFEFFVGPECEFFLFQTDENGNPTTNTGDQGGYFDMGPVDKGEDFRRDICLALEDMGFEIEASHHECAPAQHEIDFKYDGVLKSADNVMTFKYCVKNLAPQHDLHATFMPKPVFGIAGSGMHINMSLFKDGKNAFCDESDANGLSAVAYNFIAGIMKHIPAMTAITNPLVNSYKRLVPGYEAPVYVAWSASNRSPLIRVPFARGNGTRIELRNPDPSANPYLVMAACLFAGLDGVEKNMTPPAAVDGNIYDMTAAERAEKGITSLASSLEEAVNAFKGSDFIKEAMGDHVFDRYAKAKTSEWEDYRNKVTAWEIENYFVKY